RHAVLGRKLPCPPPDYLKQVEHRLADIANQRAGGPQQFEREANAARARVLEEYEQKAGQNPFFGAISGQFGFADALKTPVTGLYQEHTGRKEEIGALLDFAVLQHL